MKEQIKNIEKDLNIVIEAIKNNDSKDAKRYSRGLENNIVSK